ncbi:MAG: hypothetical protein JO253_06860 [Alphaproteobacteria bacterium]|nr:hypothetical protein [Alphaproteobacteria bacterium]
MTSMLDMLTAQFENGNFTQLNQFWYDGAGLNIGFGYNLTGQDLSPNGAAQQALAAVGLVFTPSQWTRIVNAAQDTAAIAAAAGVTNGVVATALNQYLGAASIITQSQAYQLMDNYYGNVVIPGLSSDLAHYGLNILNLPPSVAIGLEDLKYNANKAIYDTRATIKGVPNPWSTPDFESRS